MSCLKNFTSRGIVYVGNITVFFKLIMALKILEMGLEKALNVLEKYLLTITGDPDVD